MLSRNPTAGDELPDASGFFFLANTQDAGATPNSGVLFNSLHIARNWAYVTGGAQFITYAPPSVTTGVGQTLVLNSTAVAGGVACTYSWANSSGPLALGSHFSVGSTGVLTIANVQAGDADSYTLSVSTPITTENSVPPITTQTLVTVLTSESAAAIGSSQFTLNFTGPLGASYRIWSTTDVSLEPVTSTWTPVYTNTFSSGVNTFTDNAATGATEFYTITVP